MGLRLFAAILIVTSSIFAADPTLLSLALPDAQTMASVNVQQVMLSPLGQFLVAQPNLNFEKLASTFGFGLRHDPQEILVSASGKFGGNSTIVLARGTFDVARISEAVFGGGSTIQNYKGVEIIQDTNSTPKQAFAFPDSAMMIVGDPAGVRAAIDRRSAPTAVPAALAAQINQLSATEDVWFVSLAPASQLAPQSEGPWAALNKVLSISGGVKFGVSVVVTLNVVSATAQDAAAVADALKAAAGMGQTTPMAALLQTLSVSVEGSVTKIGLNIPEQQIETLIQHPPSD